MSIFPATDIISDVVNSADSRRLASGMQRLRKLSVSTADTTVATQAKSDVTHGTKGEISRAARFEAVTGPEMRAADKNMNIHSETKSQSLVAAQKFEAFILQTWIEALLPKTEGGSFGTDGSASIWRSMMAEQLATQLARGGGVGLQKIIATRQEGDVADISKSRPISGIMDINQSIRIGDRDPEEAL